MLKAQFRLHGSYRSNPLFSAQNFYSFVFLVLMAKPQGYEGTNKATITPSLLSSRHKSSVESQHSPPGKVLCPLLRKPTPKKLQERIDALEVHGRADLRIALGPGADGASIRQFDYMGTFLSTMKVL